MEIIEEVDTPVRTFRTRRAEKLYFDIAIRTHERAKCADNPDKWTSPWTERATPRDAAILCEGCPLLEECREFAFENHEKSFIYGGTTEKQRKAVGWKQENLDA